MSNVKDMVERVFGPVSDSEGVTVCNSLLHFFTEHEVGSPQMLVLPTTSITTNDSFLEAMPAFLNDLVQLMRAIYLSTIRGDGSSPELLARTSPHEIRWVGGRRAGAVLCCTGVLISMILRRGVAGCVVGGWECGGVR